MKIFAKQIDKQTIEQINEIASSEVFKRRKIRIMPDAHAGDECVIGFTSTYTDKIIPNTIGVDIGCGVYCACLGDIDIDLEGLDNFIKNNIPAGRNVYNEPIETNFKEYEKLICYKSIRNQNLFPLSLGTLGGGNHFIEIDIDENNHKYLVIHTGSRNLGFQVCKYYQSFIDNQADNIKEQKLKIIKKLKKEGRFTEIESTLKNFKPKPPKKYLTGLRMAEYLHDMYICQKYARENRMLIADKILAYLNIKPKDSFESVHNFISFEDNIIRKGAILARKNEPVIIPLNMRDGCILGFGKGNRDWNCSAPHGAGRILSRNEARRELKLDDFKKAMNGIYTTTADLSTIDESPMAYKDASLIIEAVKPTITIKNIIKPIYNFKASEGRN